MDQESTRETEPLRASGRTTTSGDREAIDTSIENPILDLQNLSLWYGSSQALVDISMQIPEKEITAFIGPSGCASSTASTT